MKEDKKFNASEEALKDLMDLNKDYETAQNKKVKDLLNYITVIPENALRKREVKGGEVFISALKTLVTNLLICNPNTTYGGYYIKNKIPLHEVTKTYGNIILDKISQLEHLVENENESDEAYIIEELETSDYCGIVGSNFKTEVYLDKEKAESRYQHLMAEEYDVESGLYFNMSIIKISK